MLMDDLKALEKPTYQEQSIIEFLLANPKAVEGASAVDLAALTYTSTSTVVRLCKKVGTKGYPDFKIRWVQELHSLDQQILIDTSKELVQKDSSVASILDMMPRVYHRVIYETNRRLDKVELYKVVQMMQSAEIINLYGSSVNYEVAKAASYNFATLGHPSYAFPSDNIQYINNISRRYPGKVAAILISHSGENTEMIRICKNLKRADIPCVILSGSRDSKLVKLGDCFLELYCTQKVLSLSNITYKISLTYIFDVLYTALFSKDFDFQDRHALKSFAEAIQK